MVLFRFGDEQKTNTFFLRNGVNDLQFRMEVLKVYFSICPLSVCHRVFTMSDDGNWRSED